MRHVPPAGAGGRRWAAPVIGPRWHPLPRNAPTIFNVVFNLAYNWDGALSTLEEQAEQVLLNPAVMRTTWPELLAELRMDPGYRATFKASYMTLL